MVDDKKDARNLSGFAKDWGLKTYWACWEAQTTFSRTRAILELCKRVEAIELKLKEKD